MNQYHFETREFGISDSGLHLLRNRFNYETISFDKIQKVTIVKGKEVKNWLLLLIMGVGFLAFVVYYVTRLFTIISDDEADVIYIEYIVVPIIPFIMGLYLIYVSVKNGLVLSVITSENKHYNLPLKSLVKDNRLEEIRGFLRNELKGKWSDLSA